MISAALAFLLGKGGVGVVLGAVGGVLYPKVKAKFVSVKAAAVAAEQEIKK